MSITTDPTTQLGKFVIHHGSPPALPGCCLLCNSAKPHIRYVDPRLDLEWHGTVYICEDCVIEMSHNLGMLTEGESDDLKDDNRILTERLAESEATVARLEQTIDLLSQRRLSDRVLSSSSVGQIEIPSDIETVPEPDNGPEGTESEVTEPVTEQGPDDVSDVGADDEPLGLANL